MNSLNASFTVTVNPGSSPLTITPLGGNLPSETVGVPDAGDVVCKISGGVAPYTVAVTQGSLPPGMQLATENNPDGSMTVVIEGTPTQSGAFSFGITVSDSAPAAAAAKPA